ncbi:MAG: glucosamine-6-phosphate deaminase [Armatimonadetes bacterium]|nr:glucosamine-6-phosphate deaminase [Armatimonadota bacterium]
MHRQDHLQFEIYRDRATLGREAAALASRTLRESVDAQGWARAIFACAPSQNEFLASLCETPLPWERIEVLHMDEYIGISADHPASFRRFLSEHLGQEVLDRATVRFLRGDATDPAGECLRYSRILQQGPIDLCCLGIGENGHLAFNDPPVADFEDPELVKKVELDRRCREQQVSDGCFPTLEEVPRHALTLTVPALIAARRLTCVVPGRNKAEAVRATLQGPISTDCPASILRTLPHCTLFIDEPSASLLSP